MERRKFLQLLGLGTAGVAFNSAVRGVIWELPKDLVLTAGPVTHEWIAAEALRVLCENFTFPDRPRRSTIPVNDLQQLGVDMKIPEEMTCSRPEFRQRFIEPGMIHLARAMEDRKAKIFLALTVPPQIGACKLMTHPASGLNLRYLRAWDPGGGGYEDDSGKWVEAYQSSGFITRFDVKFAS